MCHHYIITRFSVLDKNASINPYFTRKAKTNIKSYLFNDDRLQEKFFIFNHVTYPSIINQTSNNYTWLIYSSSHLPEKYKKMLMEINGGNIKVIFIDNFKEMNMDIEHRIAKSKHFSTVRLDDDDGLNPDFLKTISKYADEKGKVISLPNGIRIKRKGGEILKYGKTRYKKIATGMTGIGFNIYKIGNHLQANSKRGIIYDNMKDAYLVYCSNTALNSRRKC
jgi:hypothetical protein